jgi:hypothetical protein
MTTDGIDGPGLPFPIEYSVVGLCKKILSTPISAEMIAAIRRMGLCAEERPFP